MFQPKFHKLRACFPTLCQDLKGLNHLAIHTWMRRCLFLCFLSLSVGQVAQAETTTQTSDSNLANSPYQSTQALEKQATEYLKQKADQNLSNVRINVRPISDNLNLGACQTPVTLKDSRPEKREGRMTLMLECDEPSWRLYVTGEIEGDIKVVRTKRPIVKNATLTPSDLETVYVHYKRADRRAVHKEINAIGMRAKRAIPAHEVLTINLLQAPYLVFENQPIKLITDFNGLRVETGGTALENGIKNARVRVKNNRSERILKGIVVAPNTVRIP